jgi:GAF domain-containing protein
VLDVARAHLEQRPTDEVVSLLAGQAMHLALGSQAVVAVPSPDGAHVVVRVAEGSGATTLRGRSFPAEATVAAEVMRSGKAVRLADATGERGRRPAPEARDIGPALVVPLSTAAGVHGTLAISRPRGARPFSDDDQAVAEIFAQQASIVFEHARLREELDQLAVLRDRERIARELHEGVIRSLFGVGISLQVAERVGDGDGELARARLAQAMGEIDRIIVDVRDYIYELRGQPV